jgi:hypothetical protein
MQKVLATIGEKMQWKDAIIPKDILKTKYGIASEPSTHQYWHKTNTF